MIKEVSQTQNLKDYSACFSNLGPSMYKSENICSNANRKIRQLVRLKGFYGRLIHRGSESEKSEWMQQLNVVALTIRSQ